MVLDSPDRSDLFDQTLYFTMVMSLEVFRSWEFEALFSDIQVMIPRMPQPTCEYPHISAFLHHDLI